jgi:hypothetical protein
MTSFNNIRSIALAAVALAGFLPAQSHAQDVEDGQAVAEEQASARDWIDTVDWQFVGLAIPAGVLILCLRHI